MRLFVAVDLSTAALSHLEAAVAAAPISTSLRPVPSTRWHLTVAFLGEVAEHRLQALTAALSAVAEESGPIELRLRGAGTFPARPERARVLWVGVAGARPGMERLAERSAAAARSAGIPVDDRAYAPHLTLARARGQSTATADASAAVTALSAYSGPGWTVRSLRLVRSHLGPPARHDEVGAWPLAPPARAHQA